MALLPLLLLIFLTSSAVSGQRRQQPLRQKGWRQGDYPYACDSRIYCWPGEGGLLHTVQMARLYNDSKTFVDKPLKFAEATVLSNFDQMMNASGGNPTRNVVQAFVDDNFLLEGTEFEDWTPEDWHDNPAFLEKITDPAYKAFARDIHGRWKDLGRKIRSDVLSSNLSSLIPLDKPFVVPGGRFRELYYWDSYWTIQGLLLSEMSGTTRGMLENFVQLINTLGFIPNGNRIYYTRRTQPPLFLSMVEEYYKATTDRNFLEQHIDTLEKEFQYWWRNKTIEIPMDTKVYKMAVYNVEVDGPRPESYYEDYRDAMNLSDAAEFYMNMKSGAESGWDYSTKWFIGPNAEASLDIVDNKARKIVPVELNSYLCKNSRILSEFYTILDNQEKANEYAAIRSEFVDAIDTILWNDELGSWFDYDTLNEKQRLDFYISTVGPLWADCYPQTRLKERASAVVKYLKQSKALYYPGGVPTTLNPSGQQWDFPNGWPPLQELIVTGLENTGLPEAQDMALQIVKKWVKNNWLSYTQSGNSIFEKYDVNQVGLPGGGGEYDVQEGFGWTNGVLLDFFDKYGDRITSEDVIVNSAAVPGGLGTHGGVWINFASMSIAALLSNWLKF